MKEVDLKQLRQMAELPDSEIIKKLNEVTQGINNTRLTNFLSTVDIAEMRQKLHETDDKTLNKLILKLQLMDMRTAAQIREILGV